VEQRGWNSGESLDLVRRQVEWLGVAAVDVTRKTPAGFLRACSVIAIAALLIVCRR